MIFSKQRNEDCMKLDELFSVSDTLIKFIFFLLFYCQQDLQGQ